MASSSDKHLEMLCYTCGDVFSKPIVVENHDINCNSYGRCKYHHHQTVADLRAAASEHCQICRPYFDQLSSKQAKYQKRS